MFSIYNEIFRLGIPRLAMVINKIESSKIEEIPRNIKNINYSFPNKAEGKAFRKEV